ncbi:hypothetical protein D3C78_1308880 [compost metagenome]
MRHHEFEIKIRIVGLAEFQVVNDTGHRGREKINHAQQAAEQLAKFLQPVACHCRERLGGAVVVQTLEAIIIGERNIGAAGMGDRHEGGMGDDVERLQATIIRMGTPADIGEKAGRLSVTAFLFRLVDAENRKGAAAPVRQFARMFGRTGTQNGKLVGRDQQRVGIPLGFRQQRIEITFAHTLRREGDLCRFHRLQNFAHGDGAKRQKRTAVLGNRLPGRVLAVPGDDDLLEKIQHFLERQFITLHHVQRIA